jgi:putative transposon-encoded protein
MSSVRIICQQRLDKYLSIYMYILAMREIDAIFHEKIIIKDDVEEIYEKRITPYGNGAKIDAQKKYIGKRVYVIVLKD